MPTVYLISDSHFGHENILTFRRESDNALLRPFDNVDQMHDAMITAWNETVRPQDHVYHLGDFAIKRVWVQIAKWLNGHKRLVRGNHDIFKTKEYIEAGFEEIYGARVISDLLLTHIPVHPESLRRNWVNVHGHIHNNFGPSPHTEYLGPRYFNVSTEVLDHRPITIECVKQMIEVEGILARAR